MTQDALKGKGIEVDVAGFDAAMAKQKEEARKNWAGSGDAGTEKIWFEVKEKIGGTEFLGYKTTARATDIVNGSGSGNGKDVDSREQRRILSGCEPDAVLRRNAADRSAIPALSAAKASKRKFMTPSVSWIRFSVHCCRMIEGEVKVEDFASFEVNETNSETDLR